MGITIFTSIGGGGNGEAFLTDCFSDALGSSMGNITKKPIVVVGFL